MDLNSLLHKPKAYNWSPYQQAIFDAVGPLLCQAAAGAAKTTTLVEAMNRRGPNALCLSFNKAIASEMASRVSGQDVKTFNALGHRLLMRKRPEAKLNQWKVSQRARQILKPKDSDFANAIARSVSLVKNAANLDPKYGDFHATLASADLGVPFDRVPELAHVAEQAFQDTLANLTTFDFDDQLYIPIREGIGFPRYQDIYVDEAQDLSPIQHAMLVALGQRGGQIVAVGDRAQAIYGFRGASLTSMDDLKSIFRLQEYPLSISYRCDAAIVALAKTIAPHIEARPGAPDGKIESLVELPELSTFTGEDMILCRNNAPIFDLALQFIKAKLPCRVLSNFMDAIEQFINNFHATTSKDLRRQLDAWIAKERGDCAEAGQFIRLASYEDRYGVLIAFCETYTLVSEILSAIRALAASMRGPRIATIHKAKGLEAPRVFILRPDLMPSPQATSPEALQIENNLKYVAITRAKHELYFLPGA